MKDKKLFVLSVAVILIAVCYLVLSSVDSGFTKERWLNYPDARYKMIDDIERNNLLIGKTQKEVQELLGEPENEWERDFEDGYYNYYKYYIGREHEIFEMMWEPDMYLITFQNGFVVATSVQPT